MKVRYIVASAVILALGAVGYYAFTQSSIEYTDISKAERLGKTVQVVGTWVKDKGADYDEHANTFVFTLQDEAGKQIPVILKGAKPNNFEIAISVVVKGRVEGGTLHASNVLTKCPSKYEGQNPEV